MRTQIGDVAINNAFEAGKIHTEEVIDRHGRHTFASRHEMLGIMQTEQLELLKVIQDHGSMEDVRHELLDILQICVFGIACIDAETMDW